MTPKWIRHENKWIRHKSNESAIYFGLDSNFYVVDSFRHVADSFIFMADSCCFLTHSTFSTSPPCSIYEYVIKFYESGTQKMIQAHISWRVHIIKCRIHEGSWRIHFLLWRIHFSFCLTHFFIRVRQDTYMNPSSKNMNPAQIKRVPPYISTGIHFMLCRIRFD